MYEELDENTIQEPAGEEVKPLNGFIEILTQPYELGRKIIPKWFQVVAIAVLFETLCIVSGAFIISKSDGVRSEMNSLFSKTLEKMENNPSISEEKLEEMRETFEHSLDFNIVSAVGVSVATSFLPIFIIGAFFFLAARLFVEEPSPYSNIMALTGYASIVTGIGVLISSMLQFIGDSTAYSLTLSFLVDPAEHAAWFSFLSRISLFTFLYYMVLGIAVAGASKMHKNWGFILAALVLTVILLFWGGLSALSALFM